MSSYYAYYYSTDASRLMLGGVSFGRSCRFSHREDAEMRLQAVIDVHATLNTPLKIEGEVLASDRKPEIVRHCQTAQAVGCKCPECGAMVGV